MLVGPLVGSSVCWLVHLCHITSKTGYVAIALRLGFGNNLVSSISIIFSTFFLQNIIGREVESEGKGYTRT
jgi:hypothetical protein